MKIYIGKNKREAKEISLKALLTQVLYAINPEEPNLRIDIKADRFSDNSSSWVGIKQFTEERVVTTNIVFDVDNDNKIDSIEIFEAKYIVDYENEKQLI